MKKPGKRKNCKNKGCHGLKDMYKFYIENYDNPLSYKEFTEIIKASNNEILNYITKESGILELPYRLGKLQVSKFERSFNQPKNKWKIDWKRSVEEGFTVYHDQPFIYRWTWKKHNSIVKNKTGYKFIACRTASRLVPKLLSTKQIDYFK